MAGFYVNFKVPELKQALNQISAYDGRSAQKIEDAVQGSTQTIGKGARSRVPVASGGLKKSIRTSFNKKSVTGTVAARKPHAHLVEFGAKATTTVPDTKKALTIDEFGVRRYATKAKIPARRERPYMRPSYEQEKPNLIRNLAQAVKP